MLFFRFSASTMRVEKVKQKKKKICYFTFMRCDYNAKSKDAKKKEKKKKKKTLREQGKWKKEKKNSYTKKTRKQQRISRKGK